MFLIYFGVARLQHCQLLDVIGITHSDRDGFYDCCVMFTTFDWQMLHIEKAELLNGKTPAWTHFPFLSK